MNETTQTPQPTPTNTQDGNITETASIIERADRVAQRMEEANKHASELLQRQEAIIARSMLSGKTVAGSVAKTPEEIQKETVAQNVKRNLSMLY